MSDGKRKLKLLNEVLPEPRIEEGRGNPRERTLGHMQRLFTLAAAGAVLQGGGCSKDEGATDAGATPPTTDSTDAAASAAASSSAAPTASATSAPITDAGAPDDAAPGDAAPTGSAAASASVKKPPPARPRPGYHVVDMLPPPSRDRKAPER